MHDLAANNPAVTAPAAHTLYYPQSTAPAISHQQNIHHGKEDIEASDPSGQTVDVTKEELGVPLTKHDVGWRRIVRNFSPSWFAVTMGTGIVGDLLLLIPFHARWLYYLSIVFFALNSLLFILAFVTSFIRYTLYPEIWGVMIRDPANSLFLACIPIGFAVLVELWVGICVPVWGPWAVTFAWVCWMIDTIAAVAITVSIPFLMYDLKALPPGQRQLAANVHTRMANKSPIGLERITAAQLLPIAATVVAAGVGGVVADALPNPQHALGTLLTCYVIWGMSMPLALTIIVIYYQRLTLHKLPSREVIVSCFLPLGPLGYGGYGILYLGRTSIKVFEATNTLPEARNLAGPVLYVYGFITALIVWGFGIVWLVLAVATMQKSRPFPFNMGWWGFTFPLGVFAASTIQIGEQLPSMVFKVFGTIFSCAVICLWIVVAAGTAKGAWSGKLFFAPCLANLKDKKIDEKDLLENTRKSHGRKHGHKGHDAV